MWMRHDHVETILKLRWKKNKVLGVNLEAVNVDRNNPIKFLPNVISAIFKCIYDFGNQCLNIFPGKSSRIMLLSKGPYFHTL